MRQDHTLRNPEIAPRIEPMVSTITLVGRKRWASNHSVRFLNGGAKWMSFMHSRVFPQVNPHPLATIDRFMNAGFLLEGAHKIDPKQVQVLINGFRLPAPGRNPLVRTNFGPPKLEPSSMARESRVCVAGKIMWFWAWVRKLELPKPRPMSMCIF